MAAGMPERYLVEARTTKAKIEELVERLKAGAGCQDLETLNALIDDCESFGIRPSDMQSILSERNQIAGLVARMKDGINKRDIVLLKSTIEECKAQSLPEHYVAPAHAEKRRIEQMLARLGVAAQLQDLRVLKAAIEECEAAGLPERDLEGPRLTKGYIERMLAKLKAAIDLQDMPGVKAAIQECSVDMVKMAVDVCRAEGVPEKHVEEAMVARQRDAVNLPEEERQRLLEDLRNCNDAEKREKYNRAVAILNDAIQSGKEPPPEFEDLVNDLIVGQVM
jgi:hypothetical protein